MPCGPVFRQRPVLCGGGRIVLIGLMGLLLSWAGLANCAPEIPEAETQTIAGEGIRVESSWEFRWGDSPTEDGKFLWLASHGRSTQGFRPVLRTDKTESTEYTASKEETESTRAIIETKNREGPEKIRRKNTNSGEEAAKRDQVNEAIQSGAWQPLPFPKQAPDRQGRNFIWQRVQIPEGQWRDPALYIYSVDTIFEAYMDGELIYSFGNLNVENPSFEGWPFHMISLPEKPSGKYLYLRVYSDYPDIGIYHRVILDDRADLIEWLLLSRVEFLAIAGALLVIGGFALLHFLRTRESWTHLAFGLVCITEGYRALADSVYPQYMYSNMLFWHYSSWVALFLFIPAILAFFRSIYTGTEKVIMTYAYRIQLGISAIYLVYIVYDLQAVIVSVPFRMAALVWIVTIATLEVRRSLRGNKDARIIMVGFVFYGLMATAAILMDMGLLPDLRLNTHYSLFFFVCALGLVVIRRYGIMREENIRYALVSEELETARRLHQSLLPADPPQLEDLDIAVAYISQASLGGDYYDFIRIDSSQVGVLIADVSGHGLPAALGVSMAKIAFSEHTSLAHRPERFLEMARVSLVDKLQRQFLTAGALYVNSDSGLFRYASAGHPPLAFINQEKKVEWIRPRGHLIAPLPFRGYRMVERNLQPGDRLVLYTDGMSECRNSDGEFYIAQRMAEALEEAPAGAKHCLDYLVDDMRLWCGSSSFEDDVAVVVIDYASVVDEMESRSSGSVATRAIH